MLDRLPLELLDEVLDEVLDQLPSPADYSGARERTDTLLVCCLVSKRVQSRAILLVWRDIRLGDGRQSKFPAVVVLVEAGVAQSVKDLVRSCKVQLGYAPLGPAVGRILAVVQQFSVDERTVFNCLLSLQLHFLSHTSASIRSLLSIIENCPALRALVISPSDEDSADRDLFSSLDHCLARQLDMLQVPGEFSSVNAILQSPVEILVSVDNTDVVPPVQFAFPTSHIRFWADEDTASYDIDQLGQLLGSTSLSLHLPSVLHPSTSATSDELARPTTHLLARCTSLGIDVLWYDPSKEDYFDLSPSFWRYAKLLKAEQAASTAS